MNLDTFVRFAQAGELLVVTTYNRYQAISYTILHTCSESSGMEIWIRILGPDSRTGIMYVLKVVSAGKLLV